jgi:HK97 family phage portal protein
MNLGSLFGLATKSDIITLKDELSDKEFEVKKLNNELSTVLSQLSGYQTTLYGWLNNGQPVQMADNTFTYVQQGYQWNADVYSVIDLILQKLAACTPIVYEVTKENAGSVQKYRNLMQSGQKDALIKAKAIELKAMKETYMPQISDLLLNPNKYQTYQDWVKHYGGFYLLTGNTYNYYNGINPANRKWGEMYVLPAQFMQIISGGPFEPIKGYRVINQRFFGSDMYDFEASSVSHLKTFNPNYTNYGSQLYGQSPLMAYRLTMQKNMDGRKEANKQMVNGGARGILSPKAGAPPLNSDQAKDLKEQISKRVSSSSTELIDRLYASAAGLDWQQIGLPVAEMMLLESLLFDRTDICNCYHVPVQLLNNTEASTDNNMQHAMKQFIYNAVMPLANLISDRLTRDICPAYANGNKTYVIQLDPTTLPDMQDDMQNVATWMNTSWWLSPNQKLQGMGFGTSKEANMDKIILPSNMMLLDDLSVSDQQFTDAGKQAGGLF